MQEGRILGSRRDTPRLSLHPNDTYSTDAPPRESACRIINYPIDCMNTLKQHILQVLENNDRKCLDNKTEREDIAAALFDIVGEWLDKHQK